MTSASKDHDLDEWGEVIRRTPVPLAILDTSSLRLTDVNSAFAELLGRPRDEVIGLEVRDLVSLDDREAPEQATALLAMGCMESVVGRGRFRLSDGEGLDVLAWLRPLGPEAPREQALLSLMAASVGASATALEGLSRGPSVVFAGIDHEWRFTWVSADARELLGWDPEVHRGSPLQVAVHPDDVPRLLLSLGRSCAERRAVGAELRVRSRNDGWTAALCTLSPICEHNPPRFIVAISLQSSGTVETNGERASHLEWHLRRIEAEVRAAGISGIQAGEAWRADPALQELGERQSQILQRVLSGDRVATVARALHLSESTVRNHLSAIYRRFGVHSRPELMARLMAGSTTGNPEDPT